MASNFENRHWCLIFRLYCNISRYTMLHNHTLQCFIACFPQLLTWNSEWNLTSPSFSSTDSRLSCDVIMMSPPGLMMSPLVLVLVGVSEGQSEDSAAFDQSESSDAGGITKWYKWREKWNCWHKRLQLLWVDMCTYMDSQSSATR